MILEYRYAITSLLYSVSLSSDVGDLVRLQIDVHEARVCEGIGDGGGSDLSVLSSGNGRSRDDVLSGC